MNLSQNQEELVRHLESRNTREILDMIDFYAPEPDVFTAMFNKWMVDFQMVPQPPEYLLGRLLVHTIKGFVLNVATINEMSVWIINNNAHEMSLNQTYKTLLICAFLSCNI